MSKICALCEIEVSCDGVDENVHGKSTHTHRKGECRNEIDKDADEKGKGRVEIRESTIGAMG